MSPLAIVIWVLLVGAVVVVFVGGRKNKKKYAGQSMEITRDWYEQSQNRCSSDETKKAYYFQPDKHYLTQGNYMVDRNGKTVYEAFILYGDPASGYEVDFTNHKIGYKHHHKIGITSTTDAFVDGGGICMSSSFRFDGENIWRYIESLGYEYRFERVGLLAYLVRVTNDGREVGTIYSSNTGKNYFGCEPPYEAKPGNVGFYIVECADRDLDAMFLLSVAFTRTELSYENLKNSNIRL